MPKLGPHFNHEIRITKSRQEILRLLLENTYLKTRHFYRLLSDGDHQQSRERAVRRLLTDFFALGYLRRAPLVDYEARSPFLQYEFIYWLSRSGLNLARKLGLDNGLARASGEKSPHSLVHEDEITSFHLELKKLPYQLYWQQRNLKCTVNPDAVFSLRDPSQPPDSNTHCYFLEIEKSRQGHYRSGESALLKRVGTYFRYFNSDKCESEWKRFRKFRVIFVLKNDQRKQNFLEQLSERYRHRMFWVTTEEQYRRDISGKIFQTPRDHREGALYNFPS